MTEFTRNLDELLHLSHHKCRLTTFLKKNYKVNIHYIVEKYKPIIKELI